MRLTLHSSGIAVWSWNIAPNTIEADEKCSVLFGLPIGQFPIGSAAEFAAARHVMLLPGSAQLGLVVGDEVLLARAFHALMDTAVKFSDKGESVGFSCDGATDCFVPVTIETRGKTIPSSALGKFFDVFSIAEAMTPGGDLGVGPAVAQRILSLFGGSVSVANRDPSGIRFSILLRHATPNGDSMKPNSLGQTGNTNDTATQRILQAT